MGTFGNMGRYFSKMGVHSLPLLGHLQCPARQWDRACEHAREGGSGTGDCVTPKACFQHDTICREGPNLLEQKFHSQTPNTVWLADITYIDTDEGWLYLAGVKDMATREIVGWAMEDHMRAELCCAALEMALGRRGPVPGVDTPLR